LRNLDLAARRDLTLSDAFREEQIPTTARELSIKLSDVLAPLFTDVDRTDWDGFSTWGDDESSWEGRRAHGIQMFTAALTIKADLLLNIEDYEPIIYSPGTLFDEKTMETDGWDGIQGNKARGRRIALCTQAAIFIRKRADIDNGCPISEAIITNNLCGKRGRRRPRPIVKARVVVLPEEPVVLE
jgi:hypothetical protein